MLEHRWPGNVRELENCVERALLLAQGTELKLEDLPPEVRLHEEAVDDGSYRRERDEWEHHYLEDLLQQAAGSVAKAAEIAGLHRSTLYEKLARYKLVNGATAP
jgi:two-component system response regulator HydG